MHLGTTPVLPGLALSALNTQVAEQCNASLEIICSQMAYMSQCNFVKYARYFLYRYNQRKIMAVTKNQPLAV